MAHLFSELHRRHPDVDLVLLPPEPVAPVGETRPADDVVAGTLARTRAALVSLWSAVVPGSTVEPIVRWSYAADPGRVRADARLVATRADGGAVLARIRHELETDGWAVSRPPGGIERLTGIRDDLDLRASWSAPTGILVVAVTSAPLAVGAERATRLAGGR